MEESRLVKKVYIQSKKEYIFRHKVNWCKNMHKIVQKYGFEELWRDEDLVWNIPREDKSKEAVKKYWGNISFEKVGKGEEHDWKKEVYSKPKLRTYRTFKSALELEPYLKSEENPVGTKLLTALRSGTNKLRIETGRWKKPPEPEIE